MFFRAESILSWSEFVRVNRTADDEDNQDYSQVADDMQELALAPRKPGETLAARIKFDLDLPSAAADDLPVGEGEPLPVGLPAWPAAARALPGAAFAAPRSLAGCYRFGSCRRSPSLGKTPENHFKAGAAALRGAARAPRWQHGLTQGEELDLDAWVRHQVDRRDVAHRHVEAPACTPAGCARSAACPA